MCRFCTCQLSKAELGKKCAYKKNNIEQDVLWNTNGNFVDYQQSDILRPKDTGLPVIVDGKHLQSSESRLFCPMYWSLVPSWFKGDLHEWQATTHNARVENLNQSKIYSASVNEGKRCVVVMEGFFEFKKTGQGPAEVYFLQSPDNNLLKAAGLFSTVKTKKGVTLNTCTVITTEAENDVKQVHHRVPLLLRDDSDVEAWLNFKTVSSSDAIFKIKNNKQLDLKFHKTSKIGSREPAEVGFKKKILGSRSVMSNWLNSGSGKGVKRKAED
ncbi:abasic site processing protein HMCES [Phymastichus coffea]|uniref:abasic site processing protein HMCES n=1 Tax=Phymastichus coffea TaxID=108790 RepID=UPI00273C52DC|nr:abasic site processing protein HMCES [Phymastichus coffea]